MTLDLLLSALHFLLAFALVAVLAAQFALIRPMMTSSSLRTAAILDRVYGLCALLLIVAGFGRVYLGPKGSQFYLANPMFWTKIGLFALVGALSVPATVRLIRWTRRARRQPGFLPPPEQLTGTRRWLLAEGVVFVAIPFVAAAMARGFGLH